MSQQQPRLPFTPIFRHRRSDFAAPAAHRRDTVTHRSLVSAWKRRYGEIPRIADDSLLDREIWYERASRLLAAEHMIGPVEDRLTRSRAAEPNAVIDVGNFVDGLVPNQRECDLATKWYTLPAFQTAARRLLMLCNAPNAESTLRDELSVFERGARIAKNGDARMMLKIVSQAKYGPLAEVTIPRGATARDVANLFKPDFAYSFVHLDGAKDAYLWSEYVVMRYEYRVLVVGGRPVTGAGAVPQLDGACASELAWDDRVLRTVNSAIIERRPDLVDRYQVFAAGLVQMARKDAPDLRNYCLDLAVDGHDRPRLVELNALRNCGTFATHAPTLLQAAFCEAARMRLHEHRSAPQDAQLAS